MVERSSAIRDVGSLIPEVFLDTILIPKMFPVVLLLVHDCTSEVIALDEWAAPYMVASAPRMVTVKTGKTL